MPDKAISLREFFAGIGAYRKAHRVIVRHRLWAYVIFPGIMSLCYIMLLIAVGRIYFGDVSDHINRHWLPPLIKGDATEIITSILLWVLLFILTYITYKYVILIIFSPILTQLSEVTEKVICNEPAPDFSFKYFVRDIFRGLIINLRNVFRVLSMSFLAWLMAFIPVAGPPVSITLIFLIQSFYDGFGLTDYTLERKRYSVRESIVFVRRNRSRITGVGSGFMLLLLVPVAGWFTAPTYGTVAATIAALEKISENDPRLANL